MPKQNIGYLLPDEPETEDFECCIVFYPARDEYRHALMGSLDYLGTWIAWEKEPEHKGVIAARLWKIANELTRECCAMGFCQDILAKLDRIIALLALMRIDGGDTITYNDNRIVTTIIVPGVGPDPTLYGDIPVSDWEEWLEYVCGEAQAWVDDLIETAEQMAILKVALGFTIEFFSHFFSRLVYRLPQPLIPMNYPFLAFVFDLLDDVIDEVSFSTVAANFETNRAELVCAIMQDGDLSAAVETAVDDSVLWNAFYRWVDYDSVKATIYEGTPDGVNFLNPVPSSACECEQTLLWEYPFDEDISGWSFNLPNLTVAWFAPGVTRLVPNTTGAERTSGMETGDSAGARFSKTAPYPCKRVRMRFQFYTEGVEISQYFRFTVFEIGGIAHVSDTYSTVDLDYGVFYEVEFVLPSVINLIQTSQMLSVTMLRGSPATAAQSVRIDWIKFFSD